MSTFQIEANLLQKLAGENGAAGPFGLWVKAPAIALAMRNLESSLATVERPDPILHELLILVVAACRGNEGVWLAHLKKAIAAGMSPAALVEFRQGVLPGNLSAHSKACLVLAKALVERKGLSEALHQCRTAGGSEAQLVYVLTVTNLYSMACDTFELKDILEQGKVARSEAALGI